MKIRLLEDHTLALPQSFDNIDISNVRFLSMDDAAVVLRRYEDVIRQEMANPSDLDRFCDLPDSQQLFSSSFAV